jgi:hypothetical protein
MEVHSILNIDGYGVDLDVDIQKKLETLVSNDFDIEKFRKSFIEHQKSVNEDMFDGVSIDEFNGVVNRVCERGKKLKPFNSALVRTLKYGKSRLMGLGVVRKLISGELEGYSTEQLIERYCGFFEEQAEDFGELFFHVVERENCLIDYGNSLITKNQFYCGKGESIDELVKKRGAERDSTVKEITGWEGLSPVAKRSLIKRAGLRYSEANGSRDVVKKLIDENGLAIEEVDGLISWCSGMKNVLALGKERMDNYSAHLRETLVTYMQATSLGRAFKDTNSAVGGLIGVMEAAQVAADTGMKDVGDFVKRNGIYGKSIKIGMF